MSSRSPSSIAVEIDVRQIPTPERHALIFARFDELSDGDELRLLVDHEPRPLRAQFSELRARQFMWMQRFSGSEVWEVKIRKIGELARSDDIATFLARCPLTGDLSAKTREHLAQNAMEVSLERNVALVEQGEDWPYLGMVRDGLVSAILTSEFGREQTLYEVLPTEPFNETAVVDGGTTIARFVATTKDTVVFVMPLAIVAQALRDVGMAQQIALLTAQRQRSLIERFAAQISLPIVSRVASVLLSYAPPTIGLSPALSPLDGMTQVQLATAVGTAKEVLSRALAELESAHAIRRRRGRITHLDRAVLSTFAQSQ